MKFHAVIFDLDGTLLNTLADLGNSMNAALGRLGFPQHELESYKLFVGEGIPMLARRALPVGQNDEAAVKACAALMRDEYSRRWKERTTPYEGVDELLKGLTGRQIKLAVLSNKPDDTTRLMVSEFFPFVAFECVYGARDTVPRKPDPAGALEIAGLLDIRPAEIVYLGDSKTDMETASGAGMYSAGALWGFRSAEELLEHGAKTLIKFPTDLLELFNE